MRALVIGLCIGGLCIGLSACVSLSGASNTTPPFADPNSSAPQAQTVANYATPVDLPAGDYRLDARHASVQFRIRHEGQLAWFTARFNTRDATLMLDAADPTRSRLTASVDPSSVDTGLPTLSDATGFHHAIADALGAAATPRITFTSTAIRRTGQFTAQIVGDLTMNGQTHPMVLNATFDGAVVDPLRGGKEVLGFSAYGVFNRSDWGATRWAAVASDQVQIVIEAELVHT